MPDKETPSPPSSHEKIPVFVYTDDGRDVDDIEALAWLIDAENTEVVGVATTHMIPDRRAMIARALLMHMGEPDTPIGVGSIFPVGKEDAALVAYLREHTLQGRTYEGDGLIECFPSAEEVIVGAIKKYGSALKIAALAPLTDLAKVAEAHPEAFASIGGIYIQGQATVSEGTLIPDPQAYNIKEDQEAANTIFNLQDQIPLTLVGKFAAYQVPLTRTDFDGFAATGNPAGTYLKNHAIKGIQCFAERAPEVFRRVFGVEATEVDTLSELSKPYDALVTMAIARSEYFEPIQVGHHTLIGMTPEKPGLRDNNAVKENLVNTIHAALRKK
jgi:inosine-uridine nucleoside N-ribohydrolase